jgi:hypothetical protein
MLLFFLVSTISKYLYLGLLKNLLQKPASLQNAAACTIFNIRKHNPVSPPPEIQCGHLYKNERNSKLPASPTKT